MLIFTLGAWVNASKYNLEPPLVALALGLVISNVFTLPEWFSAGLRVEFYIKVGIVLLGATLPFTLLVWAGPVAVGQATIVSLVTFFVIFFAAKAFGLDRRFAAVLGVGGAVCGVSAAIAIAGAVRAKREQASVAITLVDPVGHRDDLRAAVRVAFAGTFDGGGGRLDRHVRIRRRRRHCRRASLRRLREARGRRDCRRARSIAAGVHADEGGWPRHLDRHLGVRAGDCRDDALGDRRTAASKPKPTRARSGRAFRSS